MKTIVHTDNAPAAIGPYSQAVRSGDTVYLSGQIGLDPTTMMLSGKDVAAQAEQMFKNIQAVAEAAGGSLGDIVKMTIYLTDMQDFERVNTVMQHFFEAPYPARAAIEIAGLPKGALVEADAIMVLD